jgi:hypothetical protein
MRYRYQIQLSGLKGGVGSNAGQAVTDSANTKLKTERPKAAGSLKDYS